MHECRGCEILSGNSGQVHSKGLTVAEPASVSSCDLTGISFLESFSVILEFPGWGDWFCYVRRRRTHAFRVVFPEITLKGFMDQSQGDRSWCYAISGIGRHFGLLPCGTNGLDLMWKCFLGRLELRTPLFFLRNQYNKKTFIRDRTHFSNLWLLLVL